MKAARGKKHRIAICIENEGYPVSLERHKVYQVVPDKQAERDGDLRIIDESGEDYLYAASMFVVVTVPEKNAALLEASYHRDAG